MFVCRRPSLYTTQQPIPKNIRVRVGAVRYSGESKILKNDSVSPGLLDSAAPNRRTIEGHAVDIKYDKLCEINGDVDYK